MAVSRNPLLPAGLSFGQVYTVEAFLGAGAYGEVYRVTHRYLGTQAIKVFPPDTLEPQRDFFQEARVLVMLTHPNIVRVFDANIAETPRGAVTYLAMEYIEGETLGGLLQRRVRLPLQEATRLGLDLCGGLAQAHSLEPPLLHLDLTVNNVMVATLRGQAHAKITDFGIAAQVHPVTRMARARGEYYFMAPEMFWGYATTASDVYSLGFLLYWLYAGVPPYPRPVLPESSTQEQWVASIQRSRSQPPPPLGRFRMDIPEKTAATVLKALAPVPGDRFPDAAALQAALTTPS